MLRFNTNVANRGVRQLYLGPSVHSAWTKGEDTGNEVDRANQRGENQFIKQITRKGGITQKLL